MSHCVLNCWNFHIIFTAVSPNVCIVACSAHRVQREMCMSRTALSTRGACKSFVHILTKFGMGQNGKFTL